MADEKNRMDGLISNLVKRLRNVPPPGRISRMPRIGTVATMPSRSETFAQVLPVIARQLTQVFVFLDGFETVPALISQFPNVTVIRSQDTGPYHSSGRFLCLKQLTEPCVVIPFDDDIHYPANYVARLVAALEKFEGKAVVGVHGNIFLPPFTNYVSDRKCLRFGDALLKFTRCDQLGAGTAAFCSDQLSFDIKPWPTFRSDDGYLALEAKQRGMPMWSIPRGWHWLKPIRERQAFSIWEDTKRDPSEKTELMRHLIAERVAEYENQHKARA